MNNKINEGYELLDGTKVKCFRDYYKALEEAEKLGLKEAEYGDVYGKDFSYCYWNETGDRYEDEEVIAYYKFDKNGKPIALSDEEARRVEEIKEVKFDDLDECLKEASDKEIVKDTFGMTDKETKDYLKKADKNTVKKLRKGFEQNAKKSFLTDSVEMKKTAKIVSKRPITEKKKLSERRWTYTLKNGKKLRDAINSEDAKKVAEELINSYKELFEQGLIDEYDYKTWTEDIEWLDLDTDSEDAFENINYELGNFYDLCDNINVWVSLDESKKCSDKKCHKKTNESKKLNEGASNFWSMEDLPLLIFDMYEDAYDYVWDITREQLGDDVSDDEIDQTEEFEKNFDKYYDYCLLDEYELKELEKDIKDFNEQARNDAYEDEEDYYDNDYPVVEIKPGYYQAAQLWCDTKHISDKAVEKVAKFFDEMKKKYGLTQLGVSYRFSNGETGYHKIEEDLDNDILNKTIKVYDIDALIDEEINKDSDKQYQTFHFNEGAAILIGPDGGGCIVDYEAVGKDFKSVNEEVEIAICPKDRTDENGHRVFSIVPTATLKCSVKELMEAPSKDMKVKDFFYKHDYNDRCRRNFEDIISFLSNNINTTMKESLADDKDWEYFKNNNKFQPKFDRKKYGKYFDKNGNLIPELKSEFFLKASELLHNEEEVKESLEDDKTVIYKVFDTYTTTPKSNYDARIQNARAIHTWKDFTSAQEIIDYCIKYGWAKDASDFIVIDK